MVRRCCNALVVSALLAAAMPVAAGPIVTSYLYSLSSMTGFLPLSGVRLSYDGAHKELFVIGNGLVRIFNESGIEVYEFGDDPALGGVSGVVALDDGDLLALAHVEGDTRLVRCNFRGEPLRRVELTGVPAERAGFVPNQLRLANGHIYLANTSDMTILIADATGKFISFFDVANLLGEQEHRQDLGLRGFNVDRDGNMLFTISALFQAYVLTPGGNVRAFGQRGSAPGKFNIVAGIARDDLGFIYVTDILKSAVLVFDKELRFVREFGYRGDEQGNLVAPVDVAAGDGKVFISQYAKRGVSVFSARDPTNEG